MSAPGIHAAARRCAAVLLMLLVVPLAAALAEPVDRVRDIAVADATLHPDGLPARNEPTLALPFAWDHVFPGRGGWAELRMRIPPPTSSEPRALLLLVRAGGRATVAIDGQPAQELGATHGLRAGSGKAAGIVPLPPEAAELRVSLAAEALRGTSVARLLVGPQAQIEARHATRQLLDEALPAAYAISLLLMGSLAAGLWWRLRDALYGCFSLAAFLGAVRPLDRVWPAPVPWPLWGAVLAIAFGGHLLLIARFVVIVAGRDPQWLVRTIHAVLAAVVVLASLSFAAAMPQLWTAALLLLLLLGLVCFGVVVREALTRQGKTTWFVLCAGTFLILAGGYDIAFVRTGWLGERHEPLAQHAVFFFVVLLAGIVVERYSATVADVRALNASLSQRVAERECQLREAFEALRAQQQAQAAMQERQRIMRDIHDGVGSHLVALLNLVRHPGTEPASLEPQVKLALDELRIAVDAMQPMGGDLTTVLATLRYRQQRWLEVAGIEVRWDVAALPPMAGLAPHAVMQVQRILLEAFTNVVRHAQATTITVHARHEARPEPGRVVLAVTDNGKGIAQTEVARGQGLESMRARAADIGADVSVFASPTGGTCVLLEWPLATAAAGHDPHQI